MTDPTTSSSASPSRGIQSAAAAAGSVASTVGAVAIAVQGHERLSLGLTALSAVLAFIGALSRPRGAVKA